MAKQIRPKQFEKPAIRHLFWKRLTSAHVENLLIGGKLRPSHRPAAHTHGQIPWGEEIVPLGLTPGGVGLT